MFFDFMSSLFHSPESEQASPSTPDLGLNATSVVFGDEISSGVWEVTITYGSGQGGWTNAMLADFTELDSTTATVNGGVLEIRTDSSPANNIHGLRMNLAMRVDDVVYTHRVPSGVSTITNAWMGTHLSTTWQGDVYNPNPAISMANAFWGPTWETVVNGSDATSGTTLNIAGTWYEYHGIFTNTTVDCYQNGGNNIQRTGFSVTRDYAHALAFGCYGDGPTDGQADFGEIVITGIVDTN